MMSKVIKFLNKLSYKKILKYDKINSVCSVIKFYDVLDHESAYIKVSCLDNKIYYKVGSQYLEVDEFLSEMSPEVRKHFLFNLDLFT